jgi:hypothetical protein
VTVNISKYVNPLQSSNRAAKEPSAISNVILCHRRTQSLPSNEHSNAAIKIPNHKMLTTLFADVVVKTYRFHSGLAGDINVQELMAESKLAFAFPQQLL